MGPFLPCLFHCTDAIAVIAGNSAFIAAPMRRAVDATIAKNARRFVHLGSLFESMALAC
jgi:hypothetical protein